MADVEARHLGGGVDHEFFPVFQYDEIRRMLPLGNDVPQDAFDPVLLFGNLAFTGRPDVNPFML